MLDFGLVKLHTSDPDRTLTTIDGATTGTPACLAPEIAMGSSQIDGRADLYSLGCTAYFLGNSQRFVIGRGCVWTWATAR